jgi:hypothetical protein
MRLPTGGGLDKVLSEPRYNNPPQHNYRLSGFRDHVKSSVFKLLAVTGLAASAP